MIIGGGNPIEQALQSELGTTAGLVTNGSGLLYNMKSVLMLVCVAKDLINTNSQQDGFVRNINCLGINDKLRTLLACKLLD